MTTLSTHDLSQSFPRTEGRCANLTNGDCPKNAGNGCDDAVMVCNDNEDLVFEDEDIASVEADGTQDSDQSEKQLLTAALVTSIVELAGTPSCVSSTGVCNAEITTEKKQPTRTRTKYALVTPPTSASSSLSSVKAVSESSKEKTNPDHPQILINSNTDLFKHTSRCATSEMAKSDLVNIEDVSVRKKRKLKSLSPVTTQPFETLSFGENESSDTTIPNSMVSNSSASFNTKRPPRDFSSPSLGDSISSQLFSWETCAHASKAVPIHTKSICRYRNVPSSVEQKATMVNLPVPNPLAGMMEFSSDSNTPSFSNVGSKSKGFAKKTTFLMSPAPRLRGSDPSRTGSVLQLGGQLANIAESMSSQHYQTDGLAASSVMEVMPHSRGRIFSIDLDPAVLDFVENVVDPLAAENADTPSSQLWSGNDTSLDPKNPFFTLKDDSHPRLPIRRDRGFSFEFFSLGLNEDEPLPPLPISICDGSIIQGNRMRGDSIIFDPTSFREGGIHETAALMHINQNVEGENCGDILNSPEHSVLSPPKPEVINSGCETAGASSSVSFSPVVSQGHLPCEPSKNNLSSTSQSNTRTWPKAKCQPHFAAESLKRFDLSHSDVALVSRHVPQAFSDDTIHMPHGSHAAAAAAGMPQTYPSHDGLSLSHTAYPMELLNKGGRIGIYLPEERKARIAKFHSKRKIRIWRKRIKYDCRKKLADSRPRIKGRFVKRSDVDGEASFEI